MRMTVFGGGSWGTALAHLMAEKGLEVTLLVRDPAQGRVTAVEDNVDRARHVVRHPQRICLRDILENVYDNYTEIGSKDEHSIDPEHRLYHQL